MGAFIMTKCVHSEISEIKKRLIRIESKMVRAFDSIGLNTYVDDDWLDVNQQDKVISLMVNDRSLPAIRNELIKKGIPQVKATYSLYFDAEMIGSIIY
jgi:hypothetical protein